MKAFYENRTYTDETNVHISNVRNMNFFAHWHSDIEILYVLDGTIGVGINGEYKVLQEGNISICGRNDIHYYNSDGMTSSAIMVILKPDLEVAIKSGDTAIEPCSILIDKNCYDASNVKMENKATIKQLFLDMLDESNKEDALYQKFIEHRIRELFLTLYRYLPSYYESSKQKIKRTTPISIKPVQKAIKYIEQYYNSDITLDIVSKEANLSSYYFSRLFKETTGTNFITYLNHHRIRKAHRLVENTDKSITEIAYECGFKSIRTFNRTFKSFEGVTPHSLRDG